MISLGFWNMIQYWWYGKAWNHGTTQQPLGSRFSGHLLFDSSSHPGLSSAPWTGICRLGWKNWRRSRRSHTSPGSSAFYRGLFDRFETDTARDGCFLQCFFPFGVGTASLDLRLSDFRVMEHVFQQTNLLRKDKEGNRLLPRVWSFFCLGTTRTSWPGPEWLVSPELQLPTSWLFSSSRQ